MKPLIIFVLCLTGWNANAQYNRPPYGTIDARTRELEKPTPPADEPPVDLKAIEEKAEQPDKPDTPPATTPPTPPKKSKEIPKNE